ncbi:MAG: DarT ssDNA thymidine ADP-ribosyltransferase family protein [Thiomonas sp.]|uniref:DarT ssDNA thymidine ADP-ribosyltransferase family protein n=1 Tax=Thiomonas sp. TaxID=2047785 RepID=UPI002A36E16E|nr:DarT ssDNA thymidine ADP-ribosyltransferase family protein [Thiomonas sp.]MDY0331528.1 DarT ssDNA thymidine ADP-ribosyltransferase family protein [Thiomonas sp.]
METILKHYRIDAVWHFTDRANLESIQKHHGLLSLAELQRRGVEISVPGGNEWSHDADAIKGVHEYVHLAFIDDHPMLFRAKEASRIPNPVWIKIDASILLEDGVRFTVDVSNKSGVQILTPEAARELIDFEVLFTRMDWKDPDVKARRIVAVKSEILIPTIVPINKIIGVKNG